MMAVDKLKRVKAERTVWIRGICDDGILCITPSKTGYRNAEEIMYMDLEGLVSADCTGVNAGITTLHDATSLEMEPCGKCAH